MRFPKTTDHSALGLRGYWPNTGATNRLSHAHDANLNIGLADFGFIIDMEWKGRPYAARYVTKEAGAPLGYDIGTAVNAAGEHYIWVQMRNAAGGAIGHAGLWLAGKGRHIVTVGVDRDWIIYGRDNEDIAIQIGVDANTNINQDNNGALNMFENDQSSSPQHFGPDVLSWQFYNFGVDGCPSVAEIDQIHGEMIADPDSVPVALSNRVNYATEQRMYLPFENLDPDALVITDESAFALSPTIVGGFRVRDAIKEYGCV